MTQNHTHFRHGLDFALSIALLCWLCSVPCSWAEFGIPRRDFRMQESEQVVIDGTTVETKEPADSALVQQLRLHLESAKALPEGTMEQIAVVIEAARKDPETSLLLLRLKGQDDFVALQRDWSAPQIVLGLADTVQEMKMAQILFQNPARAVVEMERDGLLPAHRVAEYRADPQLLVDDTLKSLYFTFVSYAAAGGYL
jgi:hypothetical protein